MLATSAIEGAVLVGRTTGAASTWLLVLRQLRAIVCGNRKALT